MEPAHVVMILSCDAHVETIRQILDEENVGTWVIVPGEQARRAGHLQYIPVWPSTSPHVIFGFADLAVIKQTLQKIVQAVNNRTVCPACLAYTWEVTQTMRPDLALDPVCRIVADREHSPRQAHEDSIYYFCSIDCRNRFARDPARYVSPAPEALVRTMTQPRRLTMTKDPVCGMNVDEKKAAATTVRDAKTYYFCSAGCKAAFEKAPQTYATK